jgi:glycosyltransferase involved in cell wall biosynthesis
MTPIISVVIPVYNHADTIERSLFSLYRQACRSLLEVIVVDDGSTDNFNEVIQKIQTLSWGKELHFKVISAEHKGASAARNRGMSESVGSFVIFWDADTIGTPTMIQEMYQTLSEHKEASYTYSQFRFGWKKIKSRPFNAAALHQHNYIDTTSLIRRGCVVKFDEKLKRFQDWDIWLTLLKKGQFGIFIPRVLYTKLVSPKKGISTWLPSFMHRLPWKSQAVMNYEAARQIIVDKHHLIEPVKK